MHTNEKNEEDIKTIKWKKWRIYNLIYRTYVPDILKLNFNGILLNRFSTNIPWNDFGHADYITEQIWNTICQWTYIYKKRILMKKLWKHKTKLNTMTMHTNQELIIHCHSINAGKITKIIHIKRHTRDVKNLFYGWRVIKHNLTRTLGIPIVASVWNYTKFVDLIAQLWFQNVSNTLQHIILDKSVHLHPLYKSKHEIKMRRVQNTTLSMRW